MDAVGEPTALRAARGPQRSPVACYMNELAEIRRLLERSACRRWWEVARVELWGQQPLMVVGAVGCSADFKRDRDRDRTVQTEHADARYGHATPPPVPRSVVLALEFSRRELGALRLQLLPQLSMGPAYESALAELAYQCARILQRLSSQRWTVQARLGAPCLIGSSPVMLALDRHIEESCIDTRPVVLLGTTGNEALQTAVAIHRSGFHAEQPFVKVDCETTLEPPWRWVERARGGTLFLCNTDSGNHADREHLWHQLGQALSHSTQFSNDTASPKVQVAEDQTWACRLVVALRAQQAPDVQANAFPFNAWSHCDWKVITLPQLSQHAEDIPVLTRAVLDYHGHSAEQRLTDALQHWCTNYTWPGNATQLEWTVARMAVLTASMRIGASDISVLAPRLLGDDTTVKATADAQASANDDVDGGIAADTPSASQAPGVPSPEHWVRCVLEHDTPAFTALHAGLARALQHLCQHFHESISAEQLADKAHVSVSHLRFLFRDSLGLSFKLFLQHVRIAHARRQLLESPHRRITDVALSVGFNDFSHFQKCFRDIVGQTPSKLRSARALVV